MILLLLRAYFKILYAARFMLLGAMKPVHDIQNH